MAIKNSLQNCTMSQIKYMKIMYIYILVCLNKILIKDVITSMFL